MRLMTILETGLNWILQAITDEVIYTAIFILFWVGIVFCILPVVANSLSLCRASGKIKRLQKSVLENELFRRKWLKNLWASYQVNCSHLSESQAVTEETPNCDVEDYFNVTNIITIPEKSQFSDILPGIFTSLGILGTFIGLTKGIKGIDMTTTETMRQSIETLLLGMDVAFRTSIAGVVFAVIYNLLRRFINSCALRSIRSFVRRCQDVLYQPISADTAMLSLMHSMVDAQNQTAETIKNELVEAFRMELTPALERVQNAFVEYADKAEQHQIESFTNLINRFTDSMSFLMHDQIENLSKAILNTCEMQQQQSLLLEKQNVTLNQAVESLRYHTDGIVQIENSCRSMLEQYHGYISKAGDIQSILTTAVEQFDHQAQLLTESFEKQNQSVHDTFEQMQEKFSLVGNGLELISEKVQESTETSKRQFASVIETMKEHSESVTSSLKHHTTETKDMLVQTQTEFAKQMDNILHHTAEQSAELQKEIGECFAKLTSETTDQLSKMKDEFKETINNFDQSVIHAKESFDEISMLFFENNENVAKQLKVSMENMTALSEEMINRINEHFIKLTGDTNEQFSKMNIDLHETASILQESVAYMKNAYADTKKLFADSNDEMLQRLGHALAETFKQTQNLQNQISAHFANLVADLDEQLNKLTEELHSATDIFNKSASFMRGSYEDFTNNIASGLGQSFTAFDVAMSDAVSHLKQVMDGMQEAIDDIPSKLKTEVEHLKKSVESVNALMERVPAALSKETEHLIKNIRTIADDVKRKQ